MTRTLGRLALVAGLIGMLIAPSAAAAAGPAWVDRIEDVDTVLAVRHDADFPLNSLMRAHCDEVRFVQAANGSGVETLRCRLSDEPVMIPAFQGVPPSTAFSLSLGACVWTSDYWSARDGSTVLATSVHYVITPNGDIRITARYAATAPACE
jgi:hypothetical protein